jgi:hypothetical protein
MNQFTVIFYSYRTATGQKMYKWKIKETESGAIIARAGRGFTTLAACQQNLKKFYAWMLGQ